MKAHAYTFKERDLFGETSIAITVKSGFVHRRLVRFGLWVMVIGARIAGVGHVSVDGLTDDSGAMK